MNNISKAILTILFMVAVLGYTVTNYVSGRINLVYFIVFVVLLGIPMLNMINLLIQEWKKR